MYRAFISRVSIIYIVLLVCSFLSACGTPSPQTQAACTSWQTVSSPNPGHTENKLYDAFAISSNNIWATGYYSGTPTYSDAQTLIEHWNGKTWSVVASPNPSSEPTQYPDMLGMIRGSSANDIWAVGNGLGGFLEHWDGKTWSAVNTPVPPRSIYSYDFRGVSAFSSTDAWVVGDAFPYTLSTGSRYLGLTLHWDGRAWSAVSTPELHADLNGTVLHDVAALAPDNVWAVGSTSSVEHGQLALIEHWDGKAWSVVPSPQPQGHAFTNDADLWSLSALAPDDIWADGYYDLAGVNHYLVEHWDGHAWNIFPIPVPAKTLGILYQIAAVSDYNVWVFSSDSTLLHWNGHSWSIALASQNGYLSPIAGIAAQPDGKLWLVGSKGKTGLSKTLIETSCQ